MKKNVLKYACAAAALFLLFHPVRAQWITEFVNPLPIPDTISGPVYNFEVEPSTTNFNPGVPGDTLNASIPSMCYNQPGSSANSYLGPTLMWWTGDNVTINVQNNLNVSTTVHWHGGNFDPRMDGGPQEEFASGQSFNPFFPILEGTETMWYHSHLMDHTTQQVNMGLAGFIYVRDPLDFYLNQLPHVYGVDDIPIVIQEKGFLFDSITNNVTAIDTGNSSNPHPANQKYTLVNGQIAPVHYVPKSMVRFRVLNGSIRKAFQIGFSPILENPDSFMTMFLVAGDGGYTDISYSMDSIITAPGERYELVVDFSGVSSGDTVYMSNLARSIPAQIIATSGNGALPSTNIPSPGYAFAAFVVQDTVISPDPISTLPDTFYNYSIDTSNVFHHRTKVLQRLGGPGGTWVIDSMPMDMMHINDVIHVNKREIWTIKNATNVAHPFHIHKVEFQVVEIVDTVGGIDTIQIPPQMRSRKDVVLVQPGWHLKFVADFDSFPAPLADTNGFMYHCHILTHEDVAMMHQFVVVDSVTYWAFINLQDMVEDDPFYFYPNPAEDLIYLKGNSHHGGTLRFSDALGRVLREERLEMFMDMYAVNVSSLPRGAVFLEWISGDQRFAKKIILH